MRLMLAASCWLARQARNKRLFQSGDMAEDEYLKERAEIERALSKTQPLAQPKFEIEEAVKLLTTFGNVLPQATAQEKKVFFRTVLSEVVVKNKKIVAIRPKPNYYDLLLCVRSAPEWRSPTDKQTRIKILPPKAE